MLSRDELYKRYMQLREKALERIEDGEEVEDDLGSFEDFEAGYGDYVCHSQY